MSNIINCMGNQRRDVCLFVCFYNVVAFADNIAGAINQSFNSHREVNV